MSHFFGIECGAIPEKTRVVGLHGVEGISKPYEFELLLHMDEDSSLAFEAGKAIGKRAKLSFYDVHGQRGQSIHGLIAAVELIEALPEGPVFRAVLVPELWWLSLTRHSRIFVELSVPDIIKEILKSGGITSDKFRFVLENEGRDFKPLDHVCQYQESDLDFISRWMEQEGMYYFFEQDGELEKLVITDTRTVLDKGNAETKLYVPSVGATGGLSDAFESFACRYTAVPTSVRICDYDYLRPDLEILGEASPDHSQALLTSGVSSHRANVKTKGEADRFAKVRTQELRARSLVYHGE